MDCHAGGVRPPTAPSYEENPRKQQKGFHAAHGRHPCHQTVFLAAHGRDPCHQTVFLAGHGRDLCYQKVFLAQVSCSWIPNNSQGCIVAMGNCWHHAVSVLLKKGHVKYRQTSSHNVTQLCAIIMWSLQCVISGPLKTFSELVYYNLCNMEICTLSDRFVNKRSSTLTIIPHNFLFKVIFGLVIIRDHICIFTNLVQH